MKSDKVRKRIGFDVDGVLYDWHDVVHDYCVQELGIKEDFLTFWRKIVAEEYSKTFLYNLINDPLLVIKRNIDPPILKLLNDLSKKYEIFYITSRPNAVRNATQYWFRTNRLPQIENLTICQGDKIPYIKDFKIELFVEDMKKHALALKDITTVVLVRKPWNEEVQDQFICINSVLELPPILEML